MSRFCRLCLMLMLLSASARAQMQRLDHYGVAQGLPQTQVLASFQDHSGYLWFGSYGGLSRYNGREFVTYTTEHGLGANVVHVVLADDRGRLWAGTGAGVCRLGPDQRFHCLDDPVIASVYVYSLFAEPGRLWIGTSSGLFEYRFDDGHLNHYVSAEQLTSDSVRSIARASDGALMLGTLDGLMKLEPPTGQWQAVDLATSDGAAVRALLRVGDTLWVGSSHGAFVLRDNKLSRVPGVPEGFDDADIAGLAVDRHKSGAVWMVSERGALRWHLEDNNWLRTASGLPDANMHSVLVDAEGMVWLGHDDGLSKWVPSAFVGYGTEDGLHHSFVRSLAKDHRDRLWLGTRNGVQVVQHQADGWDFRQGFTITQEQGLSEQRVFSIGFPAPGEALIGTANGLMHWREGGESVVRIDEADGLPNARVLSIFHDSQQRTWIGTVEGLVLYRDGFIEPAPEGLDEVRYPIRIQEDGRGRLWIATVDSGAWRLDQSGELVQFDARHGLTNATLWDLAADEHGGMWLASNGDGLFHINGNDQVRRYSVEDGLVDNFGWQVLHDARGSVWVYTNRGLARLRDGEWRTFGLQDGLLHLEGGATSAIECHTGELWFASAAGLMRYDPSREFFNARPPPLLIESVELEGEPVAENALLANRPGSLDFHFAALSYHSEDALRYRYRIRGLSDRWSEPMAYRPVTVAGLGGGDYVFEVQAMNPHGVWSREPLQFAFRVEPPVWATPVFWLLVLPLTIALFWLLLYWRVARIRARGAQLEYLVAQRTRELEVANRQLEKATITDPLTGLKNRRYLVNQIGTDVAQTLRAYQGASPYPNRDIVFMMVDLDYFKEINDTYGHAAGDRVLKQFSGIIQRELRESDYVVRWGGEEFLIVARQTEATRCRVMVERIIQQAREKRFVLDDSGQTISCSCSIGVSPLPFNAGQPNALSWEQVVDMADVAVYMAKRLGRDGWVALHGTGDRPIGDSVAFMRRVKVDSAQLLEEGWIALQSSYGDKAFQALTRSD